jgi:hypothetical protein
LSTYESDKAAILSLHKDWRTANGGLDIPLMRTVFPVGDAYLMFNLNGHPYFGIEEKTALWEYYQTRLVTRMLAPAWRGTGLGGLHRDRTVTIFHRFETRRNLTVL